MKARGCAVLLLSVVLLAACETKEDSRIRNEQALPAGCHIIDLDYGDLRAAVVCDGRRTSTQLRSWDEVTTQTVMMFDGKNSYPQLQTVVSHHAAITATIEPRERR